MQNKWEREEALRDMDYAKLEEMVEGRFAGIGQARIVPVDSMSQMSEAMLKAGESFRSLGVALTGVEALNHESVTDHIVIISGRGTGKQYALQKLLEQIEAGEATAPTPKKRKLYTDLGDWNECQPVEMNPYQDRLRHTQNNNWRGNGKRGKRKSK